ncbi:unnamed protein product [Caenorhabditis auriculariae]|uniref:Uncharacterized protein n=1 Tax=Caenorhabditis auriculariae TaxID=2777116 RepID=A0A8S1HDI6_9PELO|nr:unnamed protein product [Caenorhabditis auriculariae]
MIGSLRILMLLGLLILVIQAYEDSDTPYMRKAYLKDRYEASIDNRRETTHDPTFREKFEALKEKVKKKGRGDLQKYEVALLAIFLVADSTDVELEVKDTGVKIISSGVAFEIPRVPEKVQPNVTVTVEPVKGSFQPKSKTTTNRFDIIFCSMKTSFFLALLLVILALVAANLDETGAGESLPKDFPRYIPYADTNRKSIPLEAQGEDIEVAKHFDGDQEM